MAEAPAQDDDSLMSSAEQLEIDALRRELAADLEAMGPAREWPDLTGNIRLLRFVRGHPDLQARAAAYRLMLQFRSDGGLDGLRDQLVGRGLSWPELPEPSPKVEAHYRLVLYSGLTPAGDLVQIEDSGANDADGIMDTIGGEPFKHCFRCMGDLRSMILDQVCALLAAASSPALLLPNVPLAASGWLMLARLACSCLTCIHSNTGCTQRSQETGRLMKVIQIRDLGKTGLHMLKRTDMLRTSQALVTESQGSYPETLRRLIFVNTPSFFHVAHGLFSPLLSQKTLDRIQVFGEDYLQDLIDLVGIPPVQVMVEEANRWAAAAKVHTGESAAAGALPTSTSPTSQVLPPPFILLFRNPHLPEK